ncbi:MAG: hypothetical protein M3487_04285 [Actinomycetota bacterium]|nr:hypothetical protein [Acidimicrobiia bacterium]MDQ3468976.1 hypothetical protein [Actinomycetota bacterium]
MPTADDYWRAAADFEGRAREMAAEAPPVAASLTDDVVRGGRLRSVLEEAVDGIVRGFGASADGLDAIAAECRRRALACQAYTAAVEAHVRSLEAWERADPETRAALTRIPPPRREVWMQAG